MPVALRANLEAATPRTFPWEKLHQQSATSGPFLWLS